MTAIVPSYIAKLSRAKKHLIDLEAEIDRYTATKPYTVRDVVEGKKKRKVRTLEFTADPANTDIPIIAADVLYNLRSGLDHLMSALVPSVRRTSVMFPIFWEGVWESGIPGENAQRAKERARWTSCVKTLSDDAVAVLKDLQPPDLAGEPDEANLLEVVNRLSNTDRHTKLPVVAAGLGTVVLRWKMPDGIIQKKTARTPGGFLENHAQIQNIPYSAMDMQIEGSPLIAIAVKQEPRDLRRYIVLPRNLNDAARFIEEHVIPGLAPFVRASSG